MILDHARTLLSPEVAVGIEDVEDDNIRAIHLIACIDKDGLTALDEHHSQQRRDHYDQYDQTSPTRSHDIFDADGASSTELLGKPLYALARQPSRDTEM